MTDRPPIPKPWPEGLRQKRRADGTWRVWWEPSKARRALGLKPKDFDPTQPTAAVRAAEQLNRRANRMAGKAGPTRRSVVDHPRTLAEVGSAWLASPQVKRKSDATIRNYRYDVRRIEDHWDSVSLRQLTRPAVVLWYDTLYTDAGPRMAQRLITTMGTMLNWALDRGFIEANPAAKLKLETPDRRSRVVSWAEYDALLAASDELDLPWMRHAMELAMFTGQRPKDIRELRFADLSMERVGADKQSDPRLTWTLIRSKDRRRRVTRLAINREILPWLLPLWQRGDKAAFVVADAKGRQISTSRLSHAFQEIRETAARRCPSAIDARFSDLRRTFSSIAYHNGIDPANVDDALGNTAGEDPGLRQVYMPASDHAAMRAVDAVTRPKPEQ